MKRNKKHSFSGEKRDMSAQDRALAPEAFAEFAKTQNKAMDSLGEAIAEVKDRIQLVDRRSADQSDAVENVNAKFQKLRDDADGRYAEMADRLEKDREAIRNLETAFERAKAVGNKPTEGEKKLANAFMQELATGGGLERYRELARIDQRALHRFELGEAMLPFTRRHGFAGESTVVIDSDLVGDGADPYVRQGLTELIRDPIGLIDVVNEVPGVPDTDTFKEMVEDEEGKLAMVAAALNGAVTGRTVSAASSLTVHNTEGFYVGQSIYVFSSDATDEGKQGPYTISAITAGTTLTFASAVIDFDAADGDLVVSETFVATTEGAIKPAGALKATLQSATIDTLATYVIMTRQRLRRTNLFDLAAWAARTLPMRLRESLEYWLLWGSGTSPQMPGFLNSTQMTAYGVSTDTWSTDMETGDNRADTLLWSAANIPGDRQKVAVMHKLDWYRLTAAKDSNGNYVHGAGEGPRIIDSPTLKAVGGLRVVLSSKMVQNYALVMDPIQASSFVRVADASMSVGYVNDQFIQNQQTMLYEQSFAHLLKVGTAWRRVYLNQPPT